MERLRGNVPSNLQASNDIFQVNPKIVEMYQTYSACKNPASIMEQMARQVPIIEQIRSGGNMKERFYSMCKEKGIEPDSIIAQLKR